MRRQVVPALCHHKGSGQGVVRLSGKDYYCGPWGRPETTREYNRLLAEWLASDRQPLSPPSPATGSPSISIAEGILRFWSFAQKHYKSPDGCPTSELDGYRLAFRGLRALYQDTPVDQFGPLRLKTYREDLIRRGLSRRVINQYVGRLKRFFRFLVAEELCPPGVYEALRAVPGLQFGRSEARERAPVVPVSVEQIDAVLPHVSRQVACMIRVQLLSACRPGEVCLMRPADIDRSSSVWVYSPRAHKNAWRGRSRKIYLGPECQRELAPFVEGRSDDEYLFVPREAREEYQRSRSERRKSKRPPSQLARKRKARPKRAAGECYTTHAYSAAIAAACDRAGIPRWGANRLRHHAATVLRSRYGLEAAALLLGHSKLETSQVYAARDERRALEISEEIG